jgi:5-oxoprolinase (ATP-hydrolysing) subunit C
VSTLRLTRVSGLSTVQDRGRRGYLHQGVPPGGALVPELLARANAAADNPEGEAAIETFGAITIVARGPVQVGRDDGTRAMLRDGDSWTVSCNGARVAYLAVRGGIDVPLVLGARATLLVAGLGGLDGRALRAGDVLRAGVIQAARGALPPALDLQAPVGVIAGPDLDLLPAGAFEGLVTGAFRIDARSDRVGVRLEGPRLSRTAGDSGLSRPMVQGAIQLPPDGMPIVLGPDHPSTGGYPVVATVVRRDQGRLLALPIGSSVRLVASP